MTTPLEVKCTAVRITNLSLSVSSLSSSSPFFLKNVQVNKSSVLSSGDITGNVSRGTSSKPKGSATVNMAPADFQPFHDAVQSGDVFDIELTVNANDQVVAPFNHPSPTLTAQLRRITNQLENGPIVSELRMINANLVALLKIVVKRTESPISHRSGGARHSDIAPKRRRGAG
jgi:hypothetical protein